MNDPLAKRVLAEAERIQKLGYIMPAHELRQKAYDVERVVEEVKWSKLKRTKKVTRD